MSDSLQHSGLQQARLPCPSPPPRAGSNSRRVGDAIHPSHPQESPSPPAFNLSQHQELSSEWVIHIRWPKYWSLSFSNSPSNEYSGLISFRFDWFDLLAIQGTLNSLLPHHNSKVSIFRHSAFFMVQLSHPYRITGKAIALTIWTFVSKLMSLLFITLSRFVIASLPRIKHLWISWPQSLSTVILDPKKIKSITASTFFPFICLEMTGPDAMIFIFQILNFMPAFPLFYFTMIKRLFSSSSLSAITVVSSAYLRLLVFL